MQKWLGTIAAGLLAFGSASAAPILVDPAEDGSSVDATITSSYCLGCFVDVSMSDDLDDAMGWLDTGDSMTFDFFDLMVGGLIGTAEIAVNATLGLAAPSASVDGGGIGMFASFLYIFNGVQLTWIQPADIDLGDGTFLSITFENLFEFGIGSTYTISATITRYANVPEPGTAALLLVGMVGLWFASRRRPVGKAQVVDASMA